MTDFLLMNRMNRREFQPSTRNSSKMSPFNLLFVHYLLTFTLLISPAFASQEKDSEQGKLPDPNDAAAKSYQMLLGADKDTVAKVPNFFKSYGKLGVNYDIDKGQPFIWCEVSGAR